MNIKLLNFKIENVRSTASQEEHLAGRNAKVAAKSERGKTTMADAWTWLWNGRDSAGKTGRGMRPVYRSGPAKDQLIRGLTMVVEATLLISDSEMNGTFVLRKEESEIARERERKGVVEVEYSYPKSYSISGDYVLEKNFNAWIAQIAEPDIIRAMTDMKFFLADEKQGGMHHTKRRTLLRAMGGDIGTPVDFYDVDDAIKDRTLDGYRDELRVQKTKYEKERDAVPGLIGENQRIMGECKQDDTVDDLTVKRDNEIGVIASLAGKRDEVLNATQSRQDAIDKLNKLTCQKLHRETILKTDTSGTQALRDEAEQLRQKDADLKLIVTNLRAEQSATDDHISHKQNAITALMLRRSAISKEYKQADSPNCSQCDQPWPEGREKPDLADITARGQAVQSELNAKQDKLTAFQTALTKATQTRQEAEATLLASETATAKRIAEIDEQIKNHTGFEREQDDLWKAIVKDITLREAEVGEPVSEQLEVIETDKQTAETEKNRLDMALAGFDKVKECTDRIAELEARQQELAQMITTTAGKLHRVQLYQRAEAELISNAVNGRFTGVEFVLFEELLNGEVKPCCKALDKGVSYEQMSGGQSIRASVGVVDALSTYYKLWMPLFIDDRPLLTEPLDIPHQTIELIVTEGVDELRVTVEDEGKVKVA